MKDIYLGIKDYCNDCWHDFLFRHLQRYYRTQLRCLDKRAGMNVYLFFWKEGSVFYYIKQRKIKGGKK